MSEKIFLTSVFVVVAIYIMAVCKIGTPVEDYPRLSVFMGGLFCVAVIVFIVSGIWSVWS